MRKVLLIASISLMISCGPSAEEKAKDQRTADSIAQGINEKQDELIDSLDKMLVADTTEVAEKK